MHMEGTSCQLEPLFCSLRNMLLRNILLAVSKLIYKFWWRLVVPYCILTAVCVDEDYSGHGCVSKITYDI